VEGGPGGKGPRNLSEGKAGEGKLAHHSSDGGKFQGTSYVGTDLGRG